MNDAGSANRGGFGNVNKKGAVLIEGMVACRSFHSLHVEGKSEFS